MNRNLMKFTKGKWRVLHLGWENIMHPCSLGTDWRESRFAEGDFTDKTLKRSQKLTHVVKANRMLCCTGRSTDGRLWEGILPLSASEAASGVLYIVVFYIFVLVSAFHLVLSNLC